MVSWGRFANWVNETFRGCVGDAMATAAAASTPVAITCSATSAPAATSAIVAVQMNGDGVQICREIGEVQSIQEGSLISRKAGGSRNLELPGPDDVGALPCIPH